MRDIHFIDNLDFLRDGELTAKGSNGRPNEVFMRQGDLDTACAVYSLMMMLVMHRRVNRKDLTTRENKTGYTSLMRLQDTFLASLSGMYQAGYLFGNLRDELHSSFRSVATATVYTTSKGEDQVEKVEFRKIIRETIDAGYPVQVGFSRSGKDGGHALVAIAYQLVHTDTEFLRLFCLDPAFELHPQSFWNTIIDINLQPDNRVTYADYNHSEDRSINVDEILVIDE